MKRPKLKLLLGIVLLVVLGFLFGDFLLIINTIVNGVYDMKAQAEKIQAMNNTVTNVVELGSYVNLQKLDEFTKRVQLSSVAARGFVQNEWDGNPTVYNNGYIVTVSGDEVEYPDEYPEELKLGADTLNSQFGIEYIEMPEDSLDNAQEASDAKEMPDTKEASDGQDTQEHQDAADTQDTESEKSTEDTQDAQDIPSASDMNRLLDRSYVVEYCKVRDDTFYMENEKASELEKKASLSYDMEKNMDAIEGAFDTRIMLISDAETEGGRHPLLYISEVLEKSGDTAEECGITSEMLAMSYDGDSPVTVETLSNYSDTLKQGDTAYDVYIQSLKGTQLMGSGVHIAYLTQKIRNIRMTYEQTVAVLVVFFIIGLIFLVWIFSVYRLVRHYRLNNEQAEGFRLGRMFKKAFSMIAIGSVVMIIIAALFLSLFRLYNVCNTVEKSLKVLEQRIKENDKRKTKTVEELKDTYAAFAEAIAQVLTEKPELATKETLKEFSELIGADYIMIFDNKGKELLSDSQYVDMVLGTTPESATYEFRRLLKGIPVVKHDVVTDPETGLTHAMIGVCLKSIWEEGEYGALLVAVPKDKIAADNLESTNGIMQSLVFDGTLAFSVNPKTQMIVNASDITLIGRNAVSLGLPESALKDSFRDFFAFNGMSCYGESKEIDEKVYFYAAEQSHIYKNVIVYSAIAAATGFILLSVLIFFMLFGYRKQFEHWSKIGDEMTDLSAPALAEESKNGLDFMKNPGKGWELTLSKYGLRTPMHNAMVALEFLLVSADLILGIVLLTNDKSNGSLLSFVMYGHWTKGFNLFSFTSILILFAEVVIVISILKLIVSVVCSAVGQKGETFGRLANNLLTYGGVIAFVYLAFYNLGFNLGPLLASLSLPAFALSLGAKDLITDIVAGISIVFDGEYKVGDIIEVNGYRGKVLEIGVRTTKLLGPDNNIKIIYNRDVKNVLNMTRENSWYSLEVKVSTEKGLKEIETTLVEELPKIGESITDIIHGPFYRGITAFGSGTVTLLIMAECNEADYSKVQRELNHAIHDLFDQNGIGIK